MTHLPKEKKIVSFVDPVSDKFIWVIGAEVQVSICVGGLSVYGGNYVVS